ncbi:acetylglutamate kinase [Bacteroidales bacterium OttesenSCG-928-M11]|nr:acetylglutamate kinase [Bacteroidales bacterium OttesenSCG-928-M11]
MNLTIVKVGGKVVENLDSLNSLLSQFSKIAGHKMLVHGGGRSATELAERLGIESKMIDGRRITDEETLKVVTMVYGGLVNKNIVAGLQSLGLDAIGLTGADMNIMLSVKRPVKDDGIDYGFVGDVKSVNSSVLVKLMGNDFVPVLAPLTHDGKGHILNTNADTIAGEAAKALTFDYNVRLVYCFEKKGVLMDEADDNSVIKFLNRDLYEEYKTKGIITKGMIPKLENAFQAIAAGVKEVIITSAENLNDGEGTTIR